MYLTYFFIGPILSIILSIYKFSNLSSDFLVCNITKFPTKFNIFYLEITEDTSVIFLQTEVPSTCQCQTEISSNNSSFGWVLRSCEVYTAVLLSFLFSKDFSPQIGTYLPPYLDTPQNDNYEEKCISSTPPSFSPYHSPHPPPNAYCFESWELL